jgi:hypothetical protein
MKTTYQTDENVLDCNLYFFVKGLALLDEQLNRRREQVTTKKRSSVTSQRQKTSASIVTQKTTLPQVETIAQRGQAYQVRVSAFCFISFELFDVL